MLNKEFWSGKSVFLTGHTGFKGSWLTLWLSSIGAKVTGYALEPDDMKSLYFDKNFKDFLINDHEKDIRDYNKLKVAIKKADPEIIIHMAAQPLVIDSFEDPIKTYETNVMGTVNLLEAVKSLSNCRVVLVVTSDKAYENLERKEPYIETDNLNGHDPYSNSKSCAELVVSSFRNSFFNLNSFSNHGVSLATARAGNVIGAGDWAKDRLVPDLVSSLLNNKSFILRNGSAIRPWQHVLESLSGYLILCEAMWSNGNNYSEAWNFGPTTVEPENVEWVIKNFIKIWGKQIEIIDYKESSKKHEATLLSLDVSKSLSRLKWHPKWNINKTLQATVDGYKKSEASGIYIDTILSQISEYSDS